MKKIALSLLLGLSLYAANSHTAKVLETQNSGGYTYIKVQDGKQTYWVAMTQRTLHKGDTIHYTEQGWMKNFHSKTLNKTFDTILFASDTTANADTQTKTPPSNILHSSYQTKNTLSIAQLVKEREKLAGKTVTLRGKVTKVSKAIMGRNWVHIEDGSRYANIDDLVFTTQHAAPQMGDVVLATGTLIKDKDFGYGYFYPVIIQNASFKK